MGDASTPLTAADARHLLRRSGFGANPRVVADLTGATRGEAADELLEFNPSGFSPKGRTFEAVYDKWLKYMAKKTGKPNVTSASVGLQEKLVLFWHDHFATGISVVDDPKVMALQNRLFRKSCKGNFKDLVKAVNKDIAMMEFLDTVRNHKEIPNENYARELQELFTLGIKDLAGHDNYTQADIVQVARAFTGWRYTSNTLQVLLYESSHDYSTEFEATRGPKALYGMPHPDPELPGHNVGGFPGPQSFTTAGEGEPEIDTVVDIIFQHTDSEGKNTVARHIAWKLLQYFAHPEPSVAFVDDVVTASGFASSWSLAALLRAIFVHDDFYASAVPAPYGAAAKKSVKWPVDYVVGTLNLLGMKPKGRELIIQGGQFFTLRAALSSMGQILLDPPSVFGWNWETNWISNAALLGRYTFASDLAAARSGGKLGLRPEKLMLLTLTDPEAIVTAVATVLGIEDQFDDADRDAYVAYLTDGGIHPTLDLADYDVRNTKLHGLFALLMQSPQYQMH